MQSLHYCFESDDILEFHGYYRHFNWSHSKLPGASSYPVPKYVRVFIERVISSRVAKHNEIRRRPDRSLMAPQMPRRCGESGNRSRTHIQTHIQCHIHTCRNTHTQMCTHTHTCICPHKAKLKGFPHTKIRESGCKRAASSKGILRCARVFIKKDPHEKEQETIKAKDAQIAAW